MIELELQEGNSSNFEKAVKDEMQKSAKRFEQDLLSIRTGRAHPSLVEDLKISCYGGTSVMALKHLATISTPDARMIVIQAYDQSVMIDIERTIRESDLGVTPTNDGGLIRIMLPEMSSARRDELIKVLGKKLEECRINIRGVRKNYQNFVRDAQKAKKVSEDFAKRLEDLLQKTTDSFVKQVDNVGEKKSNELKG